eukprot:3541555-Prymnesium_polylepis.1
MSSEPYAKEQQWKLTPPQCSLLVGPDFRCSVASPDRPNRGACQLRDVALAKKTCSRKKRCTAVVVNREKTWATLKRAWDWGAPPADDAAARRHAQCRSLAANAYE